LVFITGTLSSFKPDEEEEVEIVNSYDNTDELLKKFPVKNPTSAETDLERKIQNRLLTGFENWNRGFAAWKAWGNILYTEDSIYNVHGTRLTLAHYQAAMNIALKQADIKMGDFHNMIINDNWTGIRYDFYTKVGDEYKLGMVTEFVNFKDYGGELGTRVVEGWGSTKDESSKGMAMFQGAEEKKVEQEQLEYMQNYKIPDTENLEEKYPVLNPTKGKGEYVEEIRSIVLNGFDSWNKGYTEWLKWVYDTYSIDAESYSLDERKRTLSEYRNEMKTLVKTQNLKKLYFDSLLISENWAALHYRYSLEELKTGEKTFGDRMEFIKFEKSGNSLKIVSTWIQ
jgi:hypothetical protein